MISCFFNIAIENSQVHQVFLSDLMSFGHFGCQNHVKAMELHRGLAVLRCFRCIDTEDLKNLEEAVALPMGI